MKQKAADGIEWQNSKGMRARLALRGKLTINPI
ncbi:hypothetical protein B23_3024 [Geobacillus thermoleovorans B23]|nr:hypothetical protein B23_3024 [Geobacillus thermoleovorans B23]